MSKLSEYIDKMNANGQLEYSDYSNLRDMADDLEIEKEEYKLKSEIAEKTLFDYIYDGAECRECITRMNGDCKLTDKEREDCTSHKVRYLLAQMENKDKQC